MIKGTSTWQSQDLNTFHQVREQKWWKVHRLHFLCRLVQRPSRKCCKKHCVRVLRGSKGPASIGCLSILQPTQFNSIPFQGVWSCNLHLRCVWGCSARNVPFPWHVEWFFRARTCHVPDICNILGQLSGFFSGIWGGCMLLSFVSALVLFPNLPCWSSFRLCC